jgi:Ca2+:H+ antiporter
VLPAFAWLALLIGYYIHWPPFTLVLVVSLIAAVLSAVHHAESIAHEVGEPFGTLVLALAVTLIEVSLIVSLMFAGGQDSSVLARDTVFAAVMIILTGMAGLCFFAGGIRHREQHFTMQGTSGALTTLVAISVLAFIFPNYTSTPGPFYNRQQLTFVAVATLLLYGSFIVAQNFRYREHFTNANEAREKAGEKEQTKHRYSGRLMIFSLLLLIFCLGAVVLLAKSLSSPLEQWVTSAGAPVSLVGVIIAAVVLLPEGLTAFQAARKNQLQKSLNLSLGSALASIGLTIPAVSFVSLFTGLPLSLGISAGNTVLFLTTLLVIILSLSTGKTTVLQGAILLIIFAVYIFSILFP